MPRRRRLWATENSWRSCRRHCWRSLQRRCDGCVGANRTGAENIKPPHPVRHKSCPRHGLISRRFSAISQGGPREIPGDCEYFRTVRSRDVGSADQVNGLEPARALKAANADLNPVSGASVCARARQLSRLSQDGVGRSRRNREADLREKRFEIVAGGWNAGENPRASLTHP
jgi:hypothetical protein